jgi:uncharacterized Zn finger protein
VDDPCYRCDGRWKIMQLGVEDIEVWTKQGVAFVVKCRSCGIVSAATRRVEAAPSRGAS